MTVQNYVKSFEDRMLTSGYAETSVESYSNYLSRFLRFMSAFGELGVFDPASARLFLRSISCFKSRSIARSALKYFFENCIDLPEIMEDVPAIRLKQAMPTVLSRVEVRNVIDQAANCKELAIISVLYTTGVRAAELRSIKVTDIQLDRSAILIDYGKGGKSRFVPVSQHLRVLLLDYLRAYKPVDYLFPGEYSDSISASALKRLVRRLGSQAGVENLHPHILRHCCATHLLESGVSLHSIQKILGHSDIRTTERYVMCATDDYRSIPELL